MNGRALTGFVKVAEEVETLVGHGHSALVGVDGAEGEVLGRRLRFRQNVEEGRLAHCTRKIFSCLHVRVHWNLGRRIFHVDDSVITAPIQQQKRESLLKQKMFFVEKISDHCFNPTA